MAKSFPVSLKNFYLSKNITFLPIVENDAYLWRKSHFMIFLFKIPRQWLRLFE